MLILRMKAVFRGAHKSYVILLKLHTCFNEEDDITETEDRFFIHRDLFLLHNRFGIVAFISFSSSITIFLRSF